MVELEFDTEPTRPDGSLFCYTYNHFIQIAIDESYSVSHKLEHLLIFLNGMLQSVSSYTEDEYSFYFDTQINQDTFIGRNHFSVLNTLILSEEDVPAFTRETVEIQKKRAVTFKSPVEDHNLIYNNGILLSNSDYVIDGNTIEFTMRLTGSIEIIRFTKDILDVNYPKLFRESIFTQDHGQLKYQKTTQPEGFEIFSNGFLLPKYFDVEIVNDNKLDFNYEITPELITFYEPLAFATQLNFIQLKKECDANNPDQDTAGEDNTDYVGVDFEAETITPDFGPQDWRPRDKQELEEDPDLNKRKFIVRLKDSATRIVANSQIVSIRTMDKLVALDKILTTPVITGNIVTLNNRNFFNRTINTFTRTLSSLSGTQEVCPEDPVILRIKGSKKGIVFGGGKNSPYSADSDYNTAAVHSGLVKVGERAVLKRIEIRYYKLESKSDSAFIGSTQNGIKTFDRIEGCGFYLTDARDLATCQNPADTIDTYGTYYTNSYTKTTLGKFFIGNYVKEFSFNRMYTGTIFSWYQDYLGRAPDQEAFNFFNKAAETDYKDRINDLKQVFLQRVTSEIANQGKTIATFTYCQFQCLAFCEAPPTKKDAHAIYSTDNILIPTKGNIRRNNTLVKQPLTLLGKTINDWFLEALNRNADRINFNKFIAASVGTNLVALKESFDNAIKNELDLYGKTLAVYTTCEYKCTQFTIPSNNLSATLKLYNAFTGEEYVGTTPAVMAFSIVPASLITVPEGQRLLFKLETTGVPPNTNIPFTITGIDLNDLSEGTLSGEFVQTETNGIAFNYRGNKQLYSNIYITLKTDFITEGDETFSFTLGNPFSTVKTITVQDSSKPEIAFYVTNNSTGKILGGDPIEIIEGDVLRFSLRTTGLPLGAKIPYVLSSKTSDFGYKKLKTHDLVATHVPATTIGTDLVYNGEFTQSLVFGDYFLSDVVTYQANTDQITDGATYFNIKVNNNPYFGSIDLGANIRIMDSSRAFGLCARVYRASPSELMANIILLDDRTPLTVYTEYANPIYPPFGIDTAVEFTGYFTSPESGPVTFSAETDNFVRIWVGNVYSNDPAFTVSNAIISTSTFQQKTIVLDRDKPYPIRIQYANGDNQSFLRISYRTSSLTQSTNFSNTVSKFNSFDLAPYNTCVTVLSPGVCKYTFLNKTITSLSTLDEDPADADEIDLANPLTIPNNAVPFIIMWSGILRLPVGSSAGNYTFGTTGVDDGIAVWIGDRAINLGTSDVSRRLSLADAVFKTSALNTQQEFEIYLEPNRNYPFKMIYIQDTGPSVFHFGLKTGGTFNTDLSNYLYNYGTCFSDIDQFYPCPADVSFNGARQFPNVTRVDLGQSTTGVVTLTYEAYTVPDRFVVVHNNLMVIDTGYVGDGKGMVGDVNTYMQGYPSSHNIGGNVIQHTPVTVIGDNDTSVGLTFNKISGVRYAYVAVFAPIPGTAWSVRVTCPVPSSTTTTTSTTSTSTSTSTTLPPTTVAPTATITLSSNSVEEDTYPAVVSTLPHRSLTEITVTFDSSVAIGTPFCLDFSGVNIKDISPTSNIGSFKGTTLANPGNWIDPTNTSINALSLAPVINVLYLKYLGRYPENNTVVDNLINDYITNRLIMNLDNAVKNLPEAVASNSLTRTIIDQVPASRVFTTSVAAVSDFTYEGTETCNIYLKYTNCNSPVETNKTFNIVDYGWANQFFFIIWTYLPNNFLNTANHTNIKVTCHVVGNPVGHHGQNVSLTAAPPAETTYWFDAINDQVTLIPAGSNKIDPSRLTFSAAQTIPTTSSYELTFTLDIDTSGLTAGDWYFAIRAYKGVDWLAATWGIKITLP